LLLGIPGGPVTRLSGPFCISGGWWRGASIGDAVRREYYFAELKRGELCWIYYDRRRRRWYRHGDVA
jgi:protein ImuB